MTPTCTPPVDEVDEFSLDLRIIEDSLPLAKMSCDTSDNCGQTCSGSACNSLTGTPF
ncbi:MAG TPA: FxLD family lanthipeptide [Pseudonocardiaceae bacterium]|jgi:FxLD family lantipeptide|nr:FxLD family lanthipeptide [Pseudonocardiaceae bacterium]